MTGQSIEAYWKAKRQFARSYHNIESLLFCNSEGISETQLKPSLYHVSLVPSDEINHNTIHFPDISALFDPQSWAYSRCESQLFGDTFWAQPRRLTVRKPERSRCPEVPSFSSS